MRCQWLRLVKRASALSFALLLTGCGTGRPVQLSKGAPASVAAVSDGVEPQKSAASSADSTAGMVLVEGGTFRMGSEEMPDESPAHGVTVNSFWIDRHEVTVGEFARFVEATGYTTEAERFGWSGVFDSATGQWERRDGASWRRPEGTGSAPRASEPVTQVSFADASLYARWAGKRLPTEAEWEYAARGGVAGKRYAWGDELRPGGKPAANWWQGEFPGRNTGEDGFPSRAPVGSFAPNGYGLHDMGGNVWEWCADWYAADYYSASPRADPRGPDAGAERVIRGGSWMCSENYCTNYRVAARGHIAPDSGLNNLGFRCARDVIAKTDSEN